MKKLSLGYRPKDICRELLIPERKYFRMVRRIRKNWPYLHKHIADQIIVKTDMPKLEFVLFLGGNRPKINRSFLSDEFKFQAAGVDSSKKLIKLYSLGKKLYGLFGKKILIKKGEYVGMIHNNIQDYIRVMKTDRIAYQALRLYVTFKDKKNKTIWKQFPYPKAIMVSDVAARLPEKDRKKIIGKTKNLWTVAEIVKVLDKFRQR